MGDVDKLNDEEDKEKDSLLESDENKGMSTPSKPRQADMSCKIDMDKLKFDEEGQENDSLIEPGENKGLSTPSKHRQAPIVADVNVDGVRQVSYSTPQWSTGPVYDKASELSMASDCVDYDGDDEAEDDYNDNGGCGDGSEEMKKKKKKKSKKQEKTHEKKRRKEDKRREEDKEECIWKSTARNIEIVPPHIRLAKLRKFQKRSLYFKALYNAVKKVTYGEQKVRVSGFNAKETDTRYPHVIIAHNVVTNVINKNKTAFNKDTVACKNINTAIKDAKEKRDTIKDAIKRTDDTKAYKERGVDINDADNGPKTDVAELQVCKSHDGSKDVRPTLPEHDDTDDVRCSSCFRRLFSRSKKTKTDEGASKRKGPFYRLVRVLGLKRSDKE